MLTNFEKMELPISKEDDSIVVEFIEDQAVVHLINDETVQKNCSKTPTRTPKHLTNSLSKPESSIKRKLNQQALNDRSNEECSENESDVLLKPKALFEDGDIPGERMFSFQQNRRPTSTSKKQITKNGENFHNKDDRKMFKISPQVLFEKKETKSKSRSTRATSKSAKLQDKNKFLDSDSQRATNSTFSYNTPKKCKKLHTTNNFEVKDLVVCIPNANSIPKTPKSQKFIHANEKLSKTPRIVRKQIAKGIAHQKIEQLNELNGSDYSISDSSDESDSDSNVHSDIKSVQPVNGSNISLRRSTRHKEVSYIYKSEEYFLSKSAKSLKSSKTSDNTLKLLKNPALDQGQVDQLSRNSNTMHDTKLKALSEGIVSNFPYWLCLLEEGFNILLYGFGSKRQIINDFRTSMLENESVLVINGFFPGLTLKEILESITIGLLDLDSCPGSAELAIQQIEETQKLKNSDHIYILIHNLDGVELQNYKTQHAISRICSLKNVHLIASIDKVNAALMFDNTKLGDYNFIWMDCTNYLSYTIETRFIESLMVKNTGSTHALSGLNNFFKSLTANAKRILLLLIKNRIENKNKKYGGVPFSKLYSWCRQQFLASTDLALRSQLVEFVDHELIKWKRDADVLYVSVDIDVLIQFYKQNEENDE